MRPLGIAILRFSAPWVKYCQETRLYSEIRAILGCITREGELMHTEGIGGQGCREHISAQAS